MTPRSVGEACAGPPVAVGRLAAVWRADLDGAAVAVKRANATAPAALVLRREARILGAVSHPAVVPVVGLVDEGAPPALVLAWAAGGTLANRRAGSDPGRDCRVLTAVAGGLDALHGAGHLHLDVTPSNVLLADGGPWLCDPAPPASGTPGWVDPAVTAGEPASVRSDVYGLAVTATAVLTGRVPAPDDALEDVDDPGLRAALASGLRVDPRARPATPGALADRIADAVAVGRGGVLAAPEAVVLPVRTWPFPHLRRFAACTRGGEMAPAACTTPLG